MLRRALGRESEMIRRWRNHPRVRGVSFTAHEIGQEEHRRWWTATMADTTRRILVYEHDGVPSGVVNLFDHDVRARTAGWGFYLDVDGLGERGELLAAWMRIEGEAVEYAFAELGISTLRGEVLVRNEAVRTLHRRYGFAEVGTYTREVDGVEEPVVVMELAR
ncbi:MULTISPECIES: UDP-4-amino-4,6-dideoxy-N-acetyl-beta-L-altrosamine N-acetyltransferase [Streptosporangium]|uniref:UDP-4-amino-4, 6-dideoxy-N-acetyl-beta-L-altrosamine N-acetyltransferase n=1 Tax=Streptosporangium brasiliense TaxID=47480 RepID=A0ABT9R184_9ACTN|nr:UDP-4-amino-4,6-dideoxy-N-acetyl-beta-L-altrosamine N-acetyltransferase [Streptosporangium brasiliense]MDP9862967.1 UDP-4-amino-4,6-dideoxy-N-acetyl-beta-L-altrosamine N-acetyltransferase [Streptosporangium brasiliense]